jgi:hypothetical protein
LLVVGSVIIRWLLAFWSSSCSSSSSFGPLCVVGCCGQVAMLPLRYVVFKKDHKGTFNNNANRSSAVERSRKGSKARGEGLLFDTRKYTSLKIDLDCIALNFIHTFEFGF